MLFLPIDNTVFSAGRTQLPTNQQRRQAQRRRICKSSLAMARVQVKQNDCRGTSSLFENVSQRRAKSPSNSQALSQNSFNSNAYKNIRQHSKDAQELISYMRKIQHNVTAPASDELDETYGISAASTQSQNRVLTTMSPSTKERLKKNLKTFAGDRNSVQPPEKVLSVGGAPPPINKFILPNHTKNAYSHLSAGKVRRRSHNTTAAAALQNSQAQITVFDGGVVPYSRDLNDETLLFVKNASKPLFDGLRKVQNVAKPRTMILNRVMQQNYERLNTAEIAPVRKIGGTTDYQSTSSANLGVQRQTQAHYKSLVDLQARKTQEEKLAARQKLRLQAAQKKESAALTAGSSRHAQKRKKSHEECKFLYQLQREEKASREKFVSRERSQTSNLCCNGGKSLKLAKHNSQDSSKATLTSDQHPFTVKLCCQCKRSVKFKQNLPSVKPRSRRDTDKVRPGSPRKATQCTQVDADLNQQYQKQGWSQTKVQVASNAYTQSEVPKQIDQSTRMSRDGDWKKDCEAQTSHRLLLSRAGKRPNTSLTQQRRPRRKLKTFNFVDVQAQQAELMNGRRFVIYSREEYASFINSRDRKRQGACSQATIIPPSELNGSSGPGSRCGRSLRYR